MTTNKMVLIEEFIQRQSKKRKVSEGCRPSKFPKAVGFVIPIPNIDLYY